MDNVTPIDEAKQKREEGAKDYRPLATMSYGDFMEKEIPPQKKIMEPFFPVQGLVMIHAKTGVGKTHIALNIAYAVASGGKFLNWNAPKPRGVLYIDGEMAEVDLQQRLAQIALSSDKDPTAPLVICNIEQQIARGMPDISSGAGQTEVWELISDDIDLIILDNLSTLSLGGKENESESWTDVQQWLLALRASGKSVLLVHHSGKGGSQRGTSKRADVLNTVINLKQSTDYTPEMGAHFEIHYEKHRGMHGAETRPIAATLETLPGEEGGAQWTWKPLEQATHIKVVDLYNEGLKQVEIHKELDLSKSVVSRHIQRARRDGEITKKENKSHG